MGKKPLRKLPKIVEKKIKKILDDEDDRWLAENHFTMDDAPEDHDVPEVF